MRVERHPYLNIWVREDGCVYLPQSGNNPAHWTYGCKNKTTGYLQVKVAGKRYLVHRLAVETFIGPIPEGCEIDHISRVRHDNRLENLRIVSRNENRRNRADHDRIEEQGLMHWYDEDRKQYNRERTAHYRAENPDKVREQAARYRAENPDKVREQKARYRQAKRKTHREVRFSDGSKHCIPLEEATLLLLIPVKDRHYGK